MPQERLEWVSIADFRQGINHNLAYNAIGTPTGYGPGAQGMASIDETFGCIALRQGGLGPLPRRDVSLTIPSQNAAVANWHVCGFVYGSINSVAVGGTPIRMPFSMDIADPATHPIDIYLGMHGYDTAAGRARYQLLRTRTYKYGMSPTNAQMHKIATAGESTSPPALFGPTYFVVQRFNHANPLQLAKPVVTAVWAEPGTHANAYNTNLIAWAFPAPQGQTPNTHNAWDWSTDPAALNPSGFICGHQNRLIDLNRQQWDYSDPLPADSDDWLVNNDYISFTQPNDTELDGSGVYDAEYVGGFGVIASISSSDLLLIGHRDGAVLIQGSIYSPIVRKLPGVIPTNGAEIIPAQTPSGVVYGVNRGPVCMFEGVGSRPISSQLPPGFWLHPNAASFWAFRGNFAVWGGWIMCPNGFLYDLESGSWWRMDDPAAFCPFQWFTSPINGYCYGVEPLWPDGGSAIVGKLQGYNPTLGAHSYSWQSQPITKGNNRIVRAREAVIVAQGTGTVVLTIKTSSGGTDTYTFNLSGSSTIPQVMRKALASRDSAQVRVKVVATGASTDPAPIIYEIRLGMEAAEHVSAA